MARFWQYPQQAFNDPETLGDSEVVKVEDFWQPLSEPVRLLPGIAFAAALIASSGFIINDPETIGDPAQVEEAIVEQWVQPTAQPILQPTGNAYAASLEASGSIPSDAETLGDPEDVTTNGWFSPFSEPVLQLRGVVYASALEASGGLNDPNSLNDLELTEFIEWFIPLSDPVLSIPRHQHQASFNDITTIGDVGPGPDRSTEWWQEFSSPVPSKAGLLAANQQAFVIDPEILNSPEVTEFIEWFQPLSEPKIEPLGKAYATVLINSSGNFNDPNTLNDPEVTELIRWFTPLSEPVLPIPRYQHLGPVQDEEGLGEAVAVSDTSIEWWQAFSEPVPPIISLGTTNQQSLAIDPEILNATEAPKFEHWWVPLSEPVLPIPRYQHQANFLDFGSIGDAAAILVATSRITIPASPGRTFSVSNPNRTFTPADD